MCAMTGLKGRIKAGVLLVPLALLLAGAVAGLVVYRMNTPERTVARIIAAYQAGDEAEVRRWLTAEGRDEPLTVLFGLGDLARRHAQPTFTVLHSTQTGHEAIVPVRMTLERAGISISPTVDWVLVREGFGWRLDVQKTRDHTMHDLYDALRV